MNSERKFESDTMMEWVDKIKNSNIIRTAKLKPTLQLDQLLIFEPNIQCTAVEPKFSKVSNRKYVYFEWKKLLIYT